MWTFVEYYLMCGLIITIAAFISGRYKMKLFGKPAVTSMQKLGVFVLFVFQAPVAFLISFVRG